MAKQTKNWEIFEREVRMLVEAFGYKAETTQPSHDYGVDVVAENQKHRVIIQCKLYGSGRIGGNTIMQLVGSREFFHATDAICITTSYFTKQAQEIASKSNVHLLDQEKLLALCREKSFTIPSMTALQTESEDILLLQEEQITIGKTDDNTLVVFDPYVSRHHAALKRTGMYLHLKDCGSTNGTFLNGRKIGVPTALNYGDIIKVGDCRIEVVFWKSTNSRG